MSIYIAHRRRKTSNALDTLVLSEQECLQWTSERLVTTRRITEVSLQRILGLSHWSSDSEGPSELSWWCGNYVYENYDDDVGTTLTANRVQTCTSLSLSPRPSAVLPRRRFPPCSWCRLAKAPVVSVDACTVRSNDAPAFQLSATARSVWLPCGHGTVYRPMSHRWSVTSRQFCSLETTPQASLTRQFSNRVSRLFRILCAVSLQSSDFTPPSSVRLWWWWWMTSLTWRTLTVRRIRRHWRSSVLRAPPCWIFGICEFCMFRNDSSLV